MDSRAVPGVDLLIQSQNRDLANIDAKIRELEATVKNYNSLVETLSNVDAKGGGITEVVSEEDDRVWREQHKARVKAAKKSEAEERAKKQISADSGSSGDGDDDDELEKRLWAKLDELERLEALEDEELLKDGDSEAGSGSRVSSRDPQSKSDDSGADVRPPVRRPISLQFQHSAAEIRSSSAAANAATPGADAAVLAPILSPADIGRPETMGTARLKKSSLKSASSPSSSSSGEKKKKSVRTARVAFEDAVSVKTIDNEARQVPFSESVLAATSIFLPVSSSSPSRGPRFSVPDDVSGPERPAAGASFAEAEPGLESEPPKRISRFKAARDMEKRSKQ